MRLYGFQIPTLRASVLGLSILTSVYFGFFFFEGNAAVRFVKETGYWFIAGTFGLLLLSLARALLSRAYGPLRWTLNIQATAFIAGMSLLLCVLVGDGYKIVMDEPVLTSTALQMYQEQEAITAARGYALSGEFLLLDAFVDKRPFFYPFLQSLFHHLFGYNGMQGVVMNTLLTPLLLVMVFCLSRRIGGELGGYIGVLLFSTVPLVAINSNGAGFELLNLVLILAVVFAGAAYLMRPNGVRLNVLLLLTVLLAQTRYESALYILAVGLLVGLVWWREKNVSITWTLMLVPFLLVMFAVQQQVMEDNPAIWQFRGTATAPFSIAYIPVNLIAASDFFLSWPDCQPNSPLLSGLFALALLCLPWTWRPFWKAVIGGDAFAVVTLVFGSITLSGFLLLLTYHWGQLNDIIATRLALPFILFQVFVVLATISQSSRYRGLSRCTIVASAGWFLAITAPALVATNYLDRSVDTTSSNILRNWVLEEKSNKPLFVTDQHLVVINEKVSGVPLFQAFQRKAQLGLHGKLGTFGAIYFVYMVDRSEEPNLKDHLQSHFVLESVNRESLGHGRILRMDRMLGLVGPTKYPQCAIPECGGTHELNSETLQFYAETLP